MDLGHFQHGASRLLGARSASQQFLSFRDVRRPRVGKFGHRSHQFDAANNAAGIDRIEGTLDDRRSGLDVIRDRWTGFGVTLIGGVKVGAKGVFQRPPRGMTFRKVLQVSVLDDQTSRVTIERSATSDRRAQARPSS